MTDDGSRVLSARQGVALRLLIQAVSDSLKNYVVREEGAGLMTDEEREKLANIEAGANNYSPPAGALYVTQEEKERWDNASSGATVILSLRENMTTEELSAALLPVIGSLQSNQGCRLMLQCDNSAQYPAVFYLSETEFGANSVGSHPLVSNVSGSSMMLRMYIYCRHSSGSIISVSYGIERQDFVTEGAMTEAMNNALAKYLPLAGGNITGNLTVGGNSVWHAGNFDPTSKADASKLDGAILGKGMGHGVVNLDTVGVGTGFQYNSDGGGSGVSGPFITFGYGGYLMQITGWHSAWQNDHHKIKYRVHNGDTGTWSDWLTFYHSGNLVEATSSAAGLMSAADKVKLDSLASAMSLSVIDTPATLEIAAISENEDNSSEEIIDPNVTVRALRAAQYEMTTDELLYDALEQFARNHPEYTEFSAWLAAKEQIRQAMPKTETTTEP